MPPHSAPSGNRDLGREHFVPLLMDEVNLRLRIRRNHVITSFISPSTYASNHRLACYNPWLYVPYSESSWRRLRARLSLDISVPIGIPSTVASILVG